MGEQRGRGGRAHASRLGRRSLHFQPRTLLFSSFRLSSLSPPSQPLWSTPLPPKTTLVTALVHVLELDAVVAATAEGDLLTLTSADGALEEVGAVGGGIVALAWSPLGDRVALVSGSGRLLLMDPTWTVLADVPVFQGWATPVPARTMPADDSDDACGGPPGSAGWAHLAPGDAYLSWRYDGQALVTTSRRHRVDQEPATLVSCTLRTWDVGGGEAGLALHALGEAVPGLAAPVTWQPNARHIYGVVNQGQGTDGKASGRARAVLFERNGLTHGGFSLGGTSGPVSGLAWSPDSEVLAVEVAGSGSSPPFVQLWRRANWHWYLKREVSLSGDAGSSPNHRCPRLAPSTSTPPALALALAWDEGAPLRLRVAYGGGELRALDFGLDVTVSPLGTAAVVDGVHILLTSLRLSIPPPPLCALAIVCPTPVICVAISPVPPPGNEGEACAGSEVLVAALSDGRLVTAAAPVGDDWEGCCLGKSGESAPPLSPGDPAGEYEHDRVGAAELPVSPADWAGGRTVREVAWLAPGRLLVALAGEVAVELGVEGRCATLLRVLARTSVLRLAQVPPSPENGDAPGVLVQASGGSVTWWRAGEDPVALPPSLPTPCPTFRALPAQPAPIPVGLSARGDLFCGGRHVSVCANSVTVRAAGPGGPFLLYTSVDAVLRSLPVETALDPATPLDGPGLRPGPPPPTRPTAEARRFAKREGDLQVYMHKAMKGRGLATTSGTDMTERAVEGGAALVCAPPGSGCRVVLQLPRGNLETISPRSLVLTAVATALVAGEYAPAAAAVATHRLDPNLLVDVGWPAFLEAAPAYVAAVVDDATISDLLRALNPSSTVAPGGLYSWVARIPGVGGHECGETNKVTAVARALRSALTAADPARYLRPILTSHAILGDLPAALDLVKTRREAELASCADIEASPSSSSHLPPQSGEALGTARRRAGALDGTAPPPTADAGLRHLLLAVSFDHLYAAALGTYDLGVAYLVALAAGRDPAEHLVDLRAWAALPSGPLRRAAIDAYLGRHESALAALIEAGPDRLESALDLAAKRGLLREAVGLLDAAAGGTAAAAWADPAALKAARASALARYAADLRSKGKPEDAAVALLAAGDTRGAIDAYRAAGQAVPALALAARAGWPRPRLRTLAADLADSLAAVGRYAEAAAISARHLDDPDSAITWLTAAHEWRAALGAAYEAVREDLVETVLAPAAADAASTTLADAREDAGRVVKYLARYKSVQARREALAAAVGPDGAGTGTGDSDTGAVAAGDDEDGGDGASAWGSDLSGLSAYTTSSTIAGGLAPSSAASTAPASTIGGRPAMRGGGSKKKKKPSKPSKRLRAGGDAEEAGLADLITSLAPKPALLTASGELTEMLILLGHEPDARLIQAALADLVSAQAAAADHLKAHPPAAVPGAAAGGAAAAPAPTATGPRWKWDLLRPLRVTETVVVHEEEEATTWRED